ncbi:tol-pal system protein YbgF [Methylotenera sp.]|uniref:tol-pal system protein YbgF n=1 Tax=Methylotenera sp. TaxID=2051956 RepID=UPI002487CDF2|nr:tol-pal system protein YbgF [Methylotenera sp.]MDI1297644.1 tol-pal system protein YbgF [Methylotenera sp.]
MMKKLILASVLLSVQLFAISGHAALFDDKEARKKILEVEATMNSQDQANQTELANLKKDFEQRLQAIEAITKGGGLMEMQNQIESLKQEVARLKGELEVANHNVDATQQRQKDLYGDTDTRLRKLESGATSSVAAGSSDTSAPPPTAVVAAPAKNTQEYQLLELANGLSKESKHKDAFNAYDKFLKDYPNSTLAAEATYGLGYSQFALKNYKSAIATQQKVIDLHPESPKVPDAMLNMANSQIQLGLVPGAKKTLRDLIAQFPNSEVTPTAQKRLKALEAIK